MVPGQIEFAQRLVVGVAMTEQSAMSMHGVRARGLLLQVIAMVQLRSD